MKKILFYITPFALFLFACKEQIPVGLDLNGNTSSVDTTYLAAPETPLLKKVCIEESTGNKCTNCPNATIQIEDMITNHPDRIISMAIHHGLEEDIPSQGYFSLENQDAVDLIDFIGQPAGQPAATFDRTIVGGLAMILRADGGPWNAAITTQLAKVSPINIHLTSSYDAGQNKVSTTVKIACTDTTSNNLMLSLFVVENGLIGAQLDNGVKVPDYEFNHVLRKAITPVIGMPLLNTLVLKEKGRVIQKVISFTPDIIWNKDKCQIIAIVHRNDNGGTIKEILQAEEVNMK